MPLPEINSQMFENCWAYSPSPVWVYNNITLAFLEVNQAATDKYGYSRDEFLSMTIRDIRPTEEVPLIENHISKNDGVSYKNGDNWRHIKKTAKLFGLPCQVLKFVTKAWLPGQLL